MEQDQIINSLFSMLQKSNSEKINMQLTIDKLTAEVNALKKEEKKETEYVHRGMAQRSFNREWQLSEDVEISKVTFEDGLLTVDLGKIVPEHHSRKDYL